MREYEVLVATLPADLRCAAIELVAAVLEEARRRAGWRLWTLIGLAAARGVVRELADRWCPGARI